MITVTPQSGDLVYMQASEGDKPQGAGEATHEGEILNITGGDDYVFDLIIRSFINYFDRRGVKRVTSKKKELFERLEKTGFGYVEEGLMALDTKIFFRRKCEG